MRLEGVTADIMVQITPDVHGPYLFKDDHSKSVLIIHHTKAIYECVKSFMLFWKLLTHVPKHEGFQPNLYNPCIMNKVINGKQCTTLFHFTN